MSRERDRQDATAEPLLEGVAARRTLSRRQMLKLAGGAIAGAAVGFAPVTHHAKAQTAGFSTNGELSPLNQYWNGGRGDNFLTATEQGRRDAIEAGYTFVRTEGWVYRHQPTGYDTDHYRPLELYWRLDRQDNFTTSVPRSNLPPWYWHVRTEGWVSHRNGESPVRVYWSSARKDYFTTATSDGVTSAQQAGYTYVRQEGWVTERPNPFGPSYLKTFWHAGRQDYMTAATDAAARDAAWVGYQCLPLYSHGVGVNPTRLPNTVPLDLYWSDSRQDNFTTATDQGRRDAVAAGYRFVRTEGYVWPTQGVVPIDPIGEWRVVPLDLYWHPGRGDNFLAMSKLMADRAKQEGYVFVRNEGFLRFPVPN